MTKVALMGVSVLGLGSLTACQSMSGAEDDRSQRMTKKHDAQHDRKMSPEQREQYKQARAEKREVMKNVRTACDNQAIGSTVSIQAGEKSITGVCAMTFKPEHKKGEKKDHHPMKGEMKGSMPMHMNRSEPLTDEKRAELTKQFAQRLAERQAFEQAQMKVCAGQKGGAKVQIKAGTQTIDGKCEVRFQPKEMAAKASA